MTREFDVPLDRRDEQAEISDRQNEREHGLEPWVLAEMYGTRDVTDYEPRNMHAATPRRAAE